MSRLAGKTALVTGAARGIGAATARRLAADGARVWINYAHSREAAEALAQEIASAGGDASLAVGDVSDVDAMDALFAELGERAGRLDILVNNAGRGAGGPIEDITPQTFDALFALNVRGLFFASQAALRLMPDGGRIINISSASSHLRHANLSIYGASKAAVDAFTRNWATELGPRGITVNSVLPGIIETEMTANIPEPLRSTYISRIVLGRIGLPEDVADVVAFLASDEARWITGQEIVASGGAYV